MNQDIINLYDEYTHKPLKREEFLKRLARLTGSTAAALAVLPLLEVNYAKAETVSGQDDRLRTERIEYPGEEGKMKGYLAMPKNKGKYPAVVVIHENRGLNPHIEDVTRRLALAGFVALAPDALSPFGGTPSGDADVREQFGKLDAARTRGSFVKAVDFLKAHSESNGKVGSVGFCWGGAMANQLAVHSPDMKAAVAFYGRQPEAADGAKINIVFVEHDFGVVQLIKNLGKIHLQAGIADGCAAHKGAVGAFA